MTESLITAPMVADLVAYRTDRYRAMGFAYDAARTLARSTEQEVDSKGRTWTRALYPGRVERMLEQGCPHDLVLAIFT